MKYKKIIALALAVIIILSAGPFNALIDIFAGISPYDSMYGKGTYSDPANYRQIHPNEFAANGASVPTAKFAVVNKINGSTIGTSASDNSTVTKVEGVPIGTTIKINNLSTVGSGSAIDMVDFQVTKGGSLVKAIQDTPSALGSYELTLNSTGTYNLYLCVRDNTAKSKTDGWGNWSYNGSHQSTGLNYGINDVKETTGTPETAGGDDFWGFWYYAQVQLIVTSDATALFTINYNNNNVTDNMDNPLLKSSANRTLALQDESVQGIVDPIISRTWYYWNVTTGWTTLAGKSGVSISPDGTTVTINDYESNLTNSTSTSKAFKLETRTQSGFTASCEHTAYFRYGSIFAYYKDVDTNADLYSASYNSNLMASTQSIAAKPAPTGYTLLTASPQSVTLDQSNPDKAVTFYYKSGAAAPGTGTIIVQYKNKKNPAEDVLPPNNSKTNVSYGTYTITAEPAPSGYIFDSAATPSPQTVVLDSSNRFVLITFYYVPVGSGGQPPIAVITGPSERMAGDNITFSGGSSIDPDGTIVDYIWDIPGATIVRNNGKTITVWYPEEGEYDLFLTVVDNDGMTGECMTSIKITPPVPTAAIDITGILKENRKITVSGAGSESPDHYPINKYTWSMTNGSDARYVGSFGSDISKDMILKKAQSYQFNLRVDNTYGLSDSESRAITIAPDVAPVPDFSVATQVLRDPNNSNLATITATNLSRSTDGDTIKKTVMFYAYDSDNDSNFDEETWYYSKDGVTWATAGLTYSQLNNFDLYNLSGGSNPATFTLKANQVGKYKFECKTIEDIPAADTIPSLLTAADYKTGITTTLKPLSSKVVEVLNTAPTVSFEVRKKKPVDIFIFTDYTGTKLDGLQSAINVKKAQFNALNIDPNFVVVNTSKTIGSQSMKKYRFYRNFFFNVKVTDGSGTNLSITEYNPYFINAGGIWEEKTDYDKPLSDIPKNRHYSYYRYMGSNSVRNGNYEIDSLNYRLYDTSGGYVDTGFHTWYNNNGFYRDFNVWSITGVGVDDAWTRDTYISTDTFNVTSINLEQIQSMNLRTGSDRYAFLLSDSVGSDFSAGYGTGYAFGSLTDTILNYMKANNFKVSVIAPQANLDANLIGEKVLDITSSGYYGFYTNIDGKTKSLGTLYPKDYGDVVYPYDRGTSFGKIVATENIGSYNSVTNYLIMQDGTVKKQTGMNDTFITIPGLTGIVKKSGNYFLRANGDCLTEAGLLVATNVSLTSDIPYLQTSDLNGIRYDIFILNNGRLYATNETNTSPAYVYDEYYTYNAQGTRTGGPYLTLVTDAKACVGNYVLKTNGDLIGRAGVYYQSGTIRFSEGNWSGYYNPKTATGIANIKKEGDFYLLTTTSGSKKYIYMERRAIYRRGEFQGYSNSPVGPYDDISVLSNYTYTGAWGDLATFLLTSDGNLRFYGVPSENNCLLSSILSAPVKLTNVKSFDGKIAITNDGKVYYLSSYGYGGSNFTLLNISNVVKTATKEYQRLDSYNNIRLSTSYLLTSDHILYAVGDSMYGQAGVMGTISTPIVTNKPNVTLTQPNLNYLTLRDVYNSLPDNKYYTAGQYSQALNDLLASYSADPSYSSNYVLLGDTVEYKVTYQDYENDPKYKEYFTYTHNQDHFDNPLGTLSVNGQTVNYPVTAFDKTGKVDIDLKIKDNPRNDDRFDNYRLANVGIVKATMYVHRKPVALQRITAVNNGNGTYTVKALDAGSYDLDHTSRVDKGITAREWRWRGSTDINWTAGQMNKSDCTSDKLYLTQLRVKDLEGVWSDWSTVTVDISIMIDYQPIAKYSIFRGSPTVPSGEKVSLVLSSDTNKGVSILSTKPIASAEYQIDIGAGYTKVANLTQSGSSFDGSTYTYQYQIADLTLPANLKDGIYSVRVKAYTSSGETKTEDRNIFVNTPVWQDYYTYGSLQAIVNPLGNIPSELETASSTAFDEKTTFDILCSDYTNKLNIQLKNGTNTLSFYAYKNGTLDLDGDGLGTTASIQSTAGSMRFRINNLQVLSNKPGGAATAGGYDFRFVFDISLVDGYPFNTGEQCTVTVTAYDTAGYSAGKYGNPQTTSLAVAGIKLFDFKVTDVRDVDFKNIFNGSGLTLSAPNLALDASDHTKGALMKKGYAFYFELRSKGLNAANDTIRIRPTFYTADTRTSLDMYYATKTDEYVLATSNYGSRDTNDTIRVFYEKDLKNLLGYHNELFLPTTLRSFNGSLQQWKGRYGIPATAIFVPKGQAPWIESNRIKTPVVVHFDIEAIKGGAAKYNYIDKGQWEKERVLLSGYPINPAKYNLYPAGDVIVIDPAHDVTDDYEAVPTNAN